MTCPVGEGVTHHQGECFSPNCSCENQYHEGPWIVKGACSPPDGSIKGFTITHRYHHRHEASNKKKLKKWSYLYCDVAPIIV